MKNLKFALGCLALLMAVSACSKDKKKGPAAPPPEPPTRPPERLEVPNPFHVGSVDGRTLQLYQYRFSANGCDSFHRVALTRSQLCRNLQLDRQNGDCWYEDREAQREQRLDYFDEMCQAFEWKPRRARRELRTMQNATVRCYMSERPLHENGIWWGWNDYILTQTLGADRMVLRHENHYAIVYKDLNGDQFSVKIEIYDRFGDLVSRHSDTWNKNNLGSLWAETGDASVKVSCWPKFHRIRSDRDRDRERKRPGDRG